MSCPARARPSRLSLGISSERAAVMSSRAVARSAIVSRTRGLCCRRRSTASLSVAGHAGRKVGRHRRTVDRNAGQRLEIDRCGVEILFGLRHLGAGRLQPLFGLLLVGDADRALGDAFAKIACQALVEGDIVLRDRDQPLLQDIVDVGAGDVERDIFGALLDARCGGIGAGGLAAHFGAAPAAVEHSLVDDQLAADRDRASCRRYRDVCGWGCGAGGPRPIPRPKWSGR